MSRRQEAYHGYLKKWEAEHQVMVQPVTSNSLPFIPNGERLSGGPRFWDWDFEGAYLLANGKVIELALTSSKMMYAVAEFGSLEHWQGFDKPMTLTQYFESW